MVSGIDLLSVSHRALSSACSLGFIRKLTVLERVSGSPLRRGRTPLPVSGAFNVTGAIGAAISSMGLGAKDESASVSEGLGVAAAAVVLRANGSGGVGRSFMAYFPSSAWAFMMSSMV